MTYWWSAAAWGGGLLDPQRVQGTLTEAVTRRAVVST